VNTPGPRGPRKPFCREMTVAHIRERKGAEYVEVVFLESARFHKLSKAHPSFDRILAQARTAMATRRVLKVWLVSSESDVIDDVHLSV
jgi:hypothetical protein